MTSELQEIKNRLERIESIIIPKQSENADINLNNRCLCGALMLCYDDSEKDCKGFKCPSCGNMKFSYQRVNH